MSYAATILADSPVGYWRLGESLFSSPAIDLTGTQNGAYVNSSGVSLSQAGIPGGGGDTSALFITANHGSVHIADNAAQHVGDVLTLEAWVKRVTTGVNDAVFNGGVLGSYGLAFNTSDQLEFARTDIVVITDSTITVTADGNWHHIVATKNGTTVTLYINGVNVTGSVTNSTIADSNGINLAFNSVDNRWFGGYLDEVAIYGTALSAAQVFTHFQAGLAPTQTLILPSLARGSFFG